MSTRREPGLILVTDRGGHLHNAKMLLVQCAASPAAILTTRGPEVASLKEKGTPVFLIPYLFTWFGKNRYVNPLNGVWSFLWAFALCVWLRPRKVISLGAFDVVPFCLVARLLGAEIFHVECMNQVSTPSVTGRVLYPICKTLFVQWPELKARYGPKAKYLGWVLS
jgi:beta-1,4-N-acetylglucosaminyltransferase